MALDLPPIVQPNIQDNNAPDLGRTMLLAQQIKQGQRTAALQSQLPGAIASYQGGNEGALAQIAAADPGVANSLVNLMRAKQEGALTSAQVQNVQQEMQQRGMEIKNQIQDQHLMEMQSAAAAAKSFKTAVQGIEDPEQIRKIYDQYHADYTGGGAQSHPELATYQGAKTDALLDQVIARGDIASKVYALRHPTPETQNAIQFGNLTPEQQQAAIGLKTGMMPINFGTGTSPAAGGAQSGVQGPPMPAKVGDVSLPPTEAEQNVAAMNIDPAVKAAAQAFLRGDGGPIPGPRAMPAQKMGWQLAQQMEPTLSAATYPAKAAAIKNFTSGGQESKNMNAAMTLVNHIADWSDNMKDLNNGGYSWINAAENAAKSVGITGNPDPFNAILSKVDIAKTAVGDEAAKAYKGVGAITEGEAKDWQEKLSHNVGPETAKANAKEIGNLLLGKLDALKDQWNEHPNMPDFGTTFIKPQTVANLIKVGVDPEKVKSLVGDSYSPQPGPKDLKLTAPKLTETPPANFPGDPQLWQHMKPEERKLFQ